MTYQRNIRCFPCLEEDALDEALQREVGDPQVRAHDRARDDHDDTTRKHLAAPGPLDLVELGPRLPDEAAALARLAVRRLLLRRRGGRPHLLARTSSLPRARRRGRRLPLGGFAGGLAAARTPLLARVAGH